MGSIEDLARSLAEFIDLDEYGSAAIGVLLLLNVHGAFVGQRVEQIVRLQGLFAALLVAKDEVYP